MIDRAGTAFYAGRLCFDSFLAGCHYILDESNAHQKKRHPPPKADGDGTILASRGQAEVAAGWSVVTPGSKADTAEACGSLLIPHLIRHLRKFPDGIDMFRGGFKATRHGI